MRNTIKVLFISVVSLFSFLNSYSQVSLKPSGAEIQGISIGKTVPNVDYPLSYESIGVSQPGFNLRLQSPNDIFFHTGIGSSEISTEEKIRMFINNDGAGILGKLNVNNSPDDDQTEALTSIDLINRGAGGNGYTWTLHTAAVGGGAGVVPNAFEIWEYPSDPGTIGCCRARIKVLPSINESSFRELVLDGKGWLGLGIDNPQSELDVRGVISTSRELELSQHAGGDRNSFIDFHASDNVDFSMRLIREPGVDGNAFLDKPGLGKLFIQNNGFRMTMLSNGNVGIGTSSPNDGKLEIQQNSIQNSIYVKNDYNSSSTIYGVNSNINGNGSGNNVALNGNAVGSSICWGLYGVGNSSNSISYGVFGFGLGDEINYGVYGTTSGGTTAYAGYFSGDLAYTGTIIDVSDKKFKRNIREMNSVLDRVMRLSPKIYEFKSLKYMNFAKGKQLGFIAQELQQEFPELVTKNVHSYIDEDGTHTGGMDYLGVNYVHLIPVLTKAIQEQQTIIENKEDRITALEEQNTQLEARLSKLEALLLGEEKNGKEHQISIPISDAQLFQNEPNPFSNHTKIQFFIPSKVNDAVMQIIGQNGEILKRIPIQKRGKGEIHLEAYALSVGNYRYTLILDGKIADSKQMILTE